jgi:hypothetical protein
MALEFIETSRDVWSYGGGRGLRDLLASAFCTLLLLEGNNQPIYLSSPWMSDFVLFDNRFHEFDNLFPGMEEQVEIRFIDFIIRLSWKLEIRIITTESETSTNFLRRLRLTDAKNIKHKFATEEYHEKGILAPSFYIEGSMNITFSGVNINGEKITYHHANKPDGAKKIASAYLEYNRRWENLS